jgi:site-specific DNA-methyltransferase (adenine-specific)
MAKLQEGPGEEKNWITPMWLIRFLEDRYGKFDLDPCACVKSHKAERWFGPGSQYGRDGLSVLENPWVAESVFMNPPYGPGLDYWVTTAYDEWRCGNAGRIVSLLPARSDTKWFTTAFNASEWLVFTGRIHFIHPATGELQTQPKFPNIVVVFEQGPTTPTVQQVKTRVMEKKFGGP